MNTNDTTFGKFKDDSGEEYYCPIDPSNVDRTAGSDVDTDSCVEASTVARYSGNVEVPARFTDRQEV